MLIRLCIVLHVPSPSDTGVLGVPALKYTRRELRTTMEPEMRQRDEALTSEDLSICDEVLNHVAQKHSIEDQADRLHLAAIVIEVYRQGVHCPEQLTVLVDASCEAMLEMKGSGQTSATAPLEASIPGRTCHSQSSRVREHPCHREQFAEAGSPCEPHRHLQGEPEAAVIGLDGSTGSAA